MKAVLRRNPQMNRPWRESEKGCRVYGMNKFGYIFFLGTFLLGSLAVAQEPPMPNWREDFESEMPSWRILHSEKLGVVVAQQRPRGDAKQGNASEKLQLRLPKESSVLLGHPLGFPLVFPDFLPSVYVKSTQPGITVGLQIVLPNSLDPKTGRPITYLVAGSKYSGSGDWEELGFRDKSGNSTLFQQIELTGRLLRAESKLNLNLQEKYVRQIVLFVEGDPNRNSETTLWIDKLQVVSHVSASRETLERFESALPYHFDPINFNGFLLLASNRIFFTYSLRSKNPDGFTEWMPTASPSRSEPLRATPHLQTGSSEERELYSPQSTLRYRLTQGISPGTATVRLSDHKLLVDNIPVGVRAIEYRGEPLAYLRQLGFNAVWVNGRATPELLKEAQTAAVWLICTPPASLELRGPTLSPIGSPNDERTIAAYPRIDPIYDNVLVWNLGDDCTNAQYKEKALWIGDLQNADQGRRPILCTANSGVREYSRNCDILLMRRNPLLSSLELGDALRWMQNYQLLARPDAAFWCTVQTQPDVKLADQWTLFGVNPQEIIAVSYEQIQLQVYQALAAGIHGLLFTSNTPLTNDDLETEYRRTALELMNLNLQLINEWFAAGVVDTAQIRSNRPNMATTVLKAERTRLLIPQWTEPKNQFGLGGAVVGDVKYVVSGVPETYPAFHLVPDRLLPLDAMRVAGGMQVSIEEANLNSLVYFGETDATHGKVSDRARLIGPKAAWLACHLAELQLTASEKVLSAIKQAKELNAIPDHRKDQLPLVNVQEQESLLRMTRDSIELAKRFTLQNPPGYASAYLQAERATRGLRVTAREMLQNATRFEPNFCLTPVSVSFATLPNYLALYNRVCGATLGPNRLEAGDMENRSLWLQAGWASGLHQISDIATPSVSIEPRVKQSGNSSLLISVNSLSSEEKPLQLETAPVWVTSPPIPIRMGELICINGWINIPRSIESGVDGFMIYDSFGGEALALRFVKKTNNWQEFVFYRYAPMDGQFFLVFSLFGIGNVYLDDVTVSAVQWAQPQTVVPPPTSPPLLQRLNPLPYLPTLPTIPNLLPGRNP